MDTNKQSSKQNSHKEEKDSSGIMKFFYLVMLLLIASSSVLSVLGSRRRASASSISVTSTPDNIPVSGGMAAISLKFHREDSETKLCEDLVITSAGDAIYSDCNAGTNNRYRLNDTERTQLDGWLQSFKQINYDNAGQQGKMNIQLFLNGQGSQVASDTNIQQLIVFVEALSAKVASLS